MLYSYYTFVLYVYIEYDYTYIYTTDFHKDKKPISSVYIGEKLFFIQKNIFRQQRPLALLDVDAVCAEAFTKVYFHRIITNLGSIHAEIEEGI